MKIVGIRFTETNNDTTYYYYTTVEHNVGDLVIAPTSANRNGADATVVEINVVRKFPYRLKILD